MVNLSSGNAGYSGTPLVKKLGYQAGQRVCVVHAPDAYWETLGELPEGIVRAAEGEGELDLVHLFVRSRQECENWIPIYRERIRPSGMIWVSWPKKASKVPTDVTEDAIRSFALEQRLVDVKVCAVDTVWSGLKLVIPVALRGK
ncbi:DUF3052 domain-containing protein [Cohnella candidum]|uniref:DUF3052 domain-containing protein n=1 Tax=Cohnella candidum TaxID=2674991 RepID=A0A3G3JWA4_9BACL|nr:DUF3052 domain-containing protein [Cohnella candidum]AYQ72533.1 DUF3052 domain-containing protein [Cohnella candidum]